MLTLKAARLFDGIQEVSPAVLRIDGSRIAATGLTPPEGTEVVDLGEATILPGLIDTHVHLAMTPGGSGVVTAEQLVESSEAALMATMERATATALAAGITTVRDLGDRGFLSLDLRDRLARDPASGPRIVAAGPPITSFGGHCHFIGIEVNDAGEIRRAIREHARRGVDVIKVMATGGELTPGSDPFEAQFVDETMRAAVEEAHEQGLPITTHAHGLPGVVQSVEAGTDSIEHVSMWTHDGVDCPDPLFERIISSEIALSLTLGFMPGAGGAPPPNIAQRLEAMLSNLARLRQAGARVVVGTDAGIASLKPHDILPVGVAQLAELGATPLQALTSATAVAADVCRVADRTGRLSPGLEADILVVDGDPLTDLGDLRRVRAVLRSGRLAAGSLD